MHAAVDAARAAGAAHRETQPEWSYRVGVDENGHPHGLVRAESNLRYYESAAPLSVVGVRYWLEQLSQGIQREFTVPIEQAIWVG